MFFWEVIHVFCAAHVNVYYVLSVLFCCQFLSFYHVKASEAAVHRPPVSGMHGRDSEGAYSIVLAGGYEDDTVRLKLL